MLDTLLIGADELLRDEQGSPKAWPVALAGDKDYRGYRAAWIDEYLMELGITPVIPSKEGDDRDNRPVPFGQAAYRRRAPLARGRGRNDHDYVERPVWCGFHAPRRNGTQPSVARFGTAIQV